MISNIYMLLSGWKYNGWTKNEIIDTVSKGIDKNLERIIAILLFQTKRTVHNLGQDVIASIFME